MILVTGGAGYIGSACAHALIRQGYKVVIIDNLSKGKKELVPKEAVFYHQDLKDIDIKEDIQAVVHFAGYKAVEESMEDAVKYSENIAGTISLLNFMVKKGIKKIIFSSSAAVYGMPDKTVIDENTPTNPINFYGYTKLAVEQLLEWYRRIHDIQFVALRYFNVAGDAGLNYVDPDAKNIIPIIMEVLNRKREKLIIFGDDWDTRDGTCIRDYIDINDLVEAHILALKTEESGIINLGTSNGVTVKELVNYTEEITNRKLNVVYGPRRPGDPAALTASNSKAKQALGWEPKTDIKEMIKTTLKAYQNDNTISSNTSIQ